MVVQQTRTSLPKIANPHTWVSNLPGYLPRLYIQYGTPVANMLARSPPFPLVVDYLSENLDITAEDEEGIILALEHRNRVRHVRFRMLVLKL